MTFDEILPYFREGHTIRRTHWEMPCVIFIPQGANWKEGESKLYHYRDTGNVLLLEIDEGRFATPTLSWHPHAVDFYADDWEVIELTAWKKVEVKIPHPSKLRVVK